VIENDCIADDIAVRFYEQDDEGNVRWEDYGNFANHDVHRQVMFIITFNETCNKRTQMQLIT